MDFGFYNWSSVQPTGISRLTETQLFGRKPCAKCGTPDSTTWCTECHISDVGDVRVFYCSESCKNSHRTHHETSCMARRRLGRSVSMLREIWTAFEKAAFVFGEEFVKAENNIVTMRSKDLMGDALTGQSIFTPFPQGCVPGNVADRVKMAILFKDGCSEPHTTGLSLLKLFLEDLGFVQQPCVCVKNPAVKVEFIDCPQFYNSHNLIKIDIPGDEAFAVDITAGQYGWDEALVPWDVFVQTRVAQFVIVHPLEGPQIQERHETYRGYSPDHAEITTHNLRRGLIGGVTKACYDYLQSHGLTLPELLDRGEPTFTEYRSAFVKHFEQSLDSGMRRLRQRGIGRLYPKGSDFAVALTEETARKCRRLWVSSQELERNRYNPREMNRLRMAWARTFP